MTRASICVHSRSRRLAALPARLVLALALLLAFVPSAFAGSSATKTITAGADTYVREGLTTSEYSNTLLRSGRFSPGLKVHRSFLRFP